MMSFPNNTFAQNTYKFVPEVVEGLGYSTLLALLGTVAYTFLFRNQEPSIYSRYERVGNPWWLPRLFGKGPQTWFTEGYEKVKLHIRSSRGPSGRILTSNLDHRAF